MANILSDGSVIPSYFGTRPQGITIGSGQMDNLALRFGEVRERIYPGDPRNQNKKAVEYTVEVEHRDGSGPGTSTMYYGCQITSAFGTSGDRFKYTLRANKKLRAGAQVILGCLNGDTDKAMILAALRDPDEPADSEDDGDNLLWEFNGVRAAINDAGELTVSFKGKTDDAGELLDSADPEASGSQIKFLVDGSVEISHGVQKFLLDHAGKQIRILAEDNLDVESTGTGNLLSQDRMTVTGTDSVLVASDGLISTESAGVRLGAAAARDALVKGTTYRQAESSMLNSLAQQLQSAAGALQSAGPAISAGAMVAPSLAGAGAAVSAAAGALQAAASAIQNFESGSEQYLSRVNKTE